MTRQLTDDRSGALEPATASMTLLVAAVIVHDTATDRVVLLQRGENAKFGQGLWDLPAGKSDPGEPVTATAVRELREETGLIVAPGALELAQVVHGAWGVESPGGFLTVVFVARSWEGELRNCEPEKHSRVCLADTAALPSAFVPSTARALRRYLDGEGPRALLHGWD
ncbi:NUDIX domain-containing protein [Streptomyces meridianus]|uniref:NUDIX domain-containing protein n=1 Tax=Streptomyces meridianus TaxID=2938945 RepID=A0ABT0X053_9ACTN|nr:NUDIX domain-containing protein [Streptomyces meridianus]MCM2575946.1 NUDIX domain-containing protein [Streptomyces meridianus]